MVALLVAVVRQRARYHLLVSDVFEVQEFALVLVVVVIEALACVARLREEACLARD